MSDSGDLPISRREQVAAFVIAPFVLTWDLFRNLVFGFFSVLERLDPLAFAARVFRRLGPTLTRLWRAVLPWLLRFQAVLKRLGDSIMRLLTPIARRLEPLLRPIWRSVRRLATWLRAVAVQSIGKVRHLVQPTLARVQRFWRWATDPFTGLVKSLRVQVRAVRAWFVRIGSR